MMASVVRGIAAVAASNDGSLAMLLLSAGDEGIILLLEINTATSLKVYKRRGAVHSNVKESEHSNACSHFAL